MVNGGYGGVGEATTVSGVFWDPAPDRTSPIIYLCLGFLRENPELTQVEWRPVLSTPRALVFPTLLQVERGHRGGEGAGL